MLGMDDALTANRNHYRRLRAGCAYLTAKEFDAKAAAIVHELRDGEPPTSFHWVRAARILVGGGW